MEIIFLIFGIVVLCGWPYHLYTVIKRHNTPNYIRLQRITDNQFHLTIKNDSGLHTAILRKVYNVKFED